MLGLGDFTEIASRVWSWTGRHTFVGPVQFLGPVTLKGSAVSVVRAIQRGTKTVAQNTASDTVTITRVDTNKAVLIMSVDAAVSHSASGTITDATTLTFTHSTGISDINVEWQVLEFI